MEVGWLETFVIATGLAMDAFAVSLGTGTNTRFNTRRAVLRIAFHFGLFQGGMAFLGWLAGRSIYTWIAAFDHWVVLLLLGWVGTRMIISGFDPESGTYCKDPTRGGTLLILCVATSIDALAVGLSFAMLQVDILFASVAIGLITFFLSMGGGLSGRFLGLKFGKRMEVVGGLILIGIGLRIIISHTWITG